MAEWIDLLERKNSLHGKPALNDLSLGSRAATVEVAETRVVSSPCSE
jgi:hypothetical protein